MIGHVRRFASGRAVAAPATVWVVVAALVFLLWDLGIDVPVFAEPEPRVVGAVELLCLVGIAVSAWGLAPRMATWDAHARPLVGRMAAASAALTLLIAGTIATAVLHVVYRLPARWVPRSEFLHARFELDSLIPTVGRPQLTNVLVAGAAILIAVALLGRVAGTGVVLLSYYPMIMLAGRPGWSELLPYSAAGPGIERSAHPVAAVVLSAVAVAAWRRTAGTTRLARRLDPRH